MKIYCTYCSAHKDESVSLLPAIARYRSSRIVFISKLAKSEKIEFRIFSGRFGLLKPDDKIPYYDHLLLESEVVEHAQFISQQIEEAGITEIEFYMSSPEEDNKLFPYLNCIRLACNSTNSLLTIIVSEFPSDEIQF